MSSGTVITGAVVSTRTTVIVKLFCAVLPCASVALHVTVFGPTGNLLPEAGLHVGAIAPSTLSCALAEYVTVAPDGSGVLRLKLAGTVITGGVVSTRFTVTVKPFCALLPCESVAVHVTLVGPSGKVLPDAGVQLGVSGPSRLSFALAG